MKKCDGFGCGFSCTAVSRMNSNARSNMCTMFSGGNATADTFKSMIEYMKKHRPWWGLAENVESFDEKAYTTDEVSLGRSCL